MTHWRQLMDQEYVGAWDLPAGRDVPVTISKVESVKLEARGDDDRRKKDEHKVLLHFKGKDKPMVANATNCKTIARLYGNDTRKWVGERIALYSTTTRAFGETHDCIRVRPKKPGEPKAATDARDAAEVEKREQRRAEMSPQDRQELEEAEKAMRDVLATPAREPGDDNE